MTVPLDARILYWGDLPDARQLHVLSTTPVSLLREALRDAMDYAATPVWCARCEDLNRYCPDHAKQAIRFWAYRELLERIGDET